MGENIQVVAVNLDLTRNIWCFKYKVRHTRCAREKCEGARAKEGGPGGIKTPFFLSTPLFGLCHAI